MHEDQQTMKSQKTDARSRVYRPQNGVLSEKEKGAVENTERIFETRRRVD